MWFWLHLAFRMGQIHKADPSWDSNNVILVVASNCNKQKPSHFHSTYRFISCSQKHSNGFLPDQVHTPHNLTKYFLSFDFSLFSLFRNNEFWDELIVYFHLISRGPHRKLNNSERRREKSDLRLGKKLGKDEGTAMSSHEIRKPKKLTGIHREKYKNRVQDDIISLILFFKIYLKFIF
jgi:hypothetical protein